ncbi:MAG: 3-deoxy-manno-octulosonate cytidylyltransferase, partial [Phototrophicales bacterium]
MDKVAAAIIIPARYGSTRFEGKPLALLAGQPMLY